VEAKGLRANVIQGTERTVIAAVGEERIAGVTALESGPGVDEVLPILAPYKLASRELKSETSVINAGSFSVGGKKIGIIAGPCSGESEGHSGTTAKAGQAGGATASGAGG